MKMHPKTFKITFEKGDVVDLSKRDTPEARLTKGIFDRYLFEYFSELSSGQTGYGVDFISWLSMAKDWHHFGLSRYSYKVRMQDK